jgi:hypothetical protein
MSSLTLPTGAKPTNLELPPGVNAQYIDSDVFDICGRLAELDKCLYVLVVTGRPGTDFFIMENCEDGTQRMIFRVGSDHEIDALDSRVINKCRLIMSLPLHLRVAAIQREIDKREAARVEASLEELYETVGAPMWPLLEKTGFIQRPVSYPKIGVTARGRRAR